MPGLYIPIYRLAPTIWNSIKSYIFNGLNDALLVMFNKELTKCDIITIITGDCQNAEEKFIQISTEFVQAITDSTESNPFDLELKSILQTFSTVMQEGSPAMGIPVLDPFHVPQFDVPSISNGIVNAKITITNVIGRHLSLFEVISVKTVLNDDFKQGNLLKGIDNKINFLFTYILFSVTHCFVGKQNGSKLLLFIRTVRAPL